jgi:uncharacterized phiE125 gp8 family phage protein
MTLKLQTAPDPALPVVSLADARLQLKLLPSDPTTEDGLIAACVSAATMDAEHIMQRAVMPQKWQLTVDQFARDPNWSRVYSIGLTSASAYYDGLDLQRPPVTGIDSIKYVDAVNGTLTTLASTEYQLVNASDYTARVVPAYGKSWPSVRPQPEAVQILFSCGYVDAASVPEAIKQWIKLRAASLFNNRESVTIGTRLVRIDLPFVDSLLDRYIAKVL